jgi:hypothetical protein
MLAGVLPLEPCFHPILLWLLGDGGSHKLFAQADESQSS